MFKNYLLYIRQVLHAAAGNEINGVILQKKIRFSFALSVTLLSIVLAMSVSFTPKYITDAVLAEVNENIPKEMIDIKLDADYSTKADLLSLNQSVNEAKNIIADNIAHNITSEDILNAKATSIGGDTYKYEIESNENLQSPITLIVEHNKTTGDTKIKSATTHVSQEYIENTVKELQTANTEQNTQKIKSTSVAKQKDYAFELPKTTEEEQTDDNQTKEDATSKEEKETEENTKQNVKISETVSFIVPEGYEEKTSELQQILDENNNVIVETNEDESDDTEDEKNAETEPEEESTENETIEDDESPSEEETLNAFVDVDEEESKDYIRTWRNGHGASFTITSNSLDDVFKALDGLEIVDKLSGYWKETLSQLTSEVNQEGVETELIEETLKENESETQETEESTEEQNKTTDDIQIKSFYEPNAKMWGYFGTAKFSDDIRDITYNRLVLIDNEDSRIYSVIYRSDTAQDSENKEAINLKDFTKLFEIKTEVERNELEQANLTDKQN